MKKLVIAAALILVFAFSFSIAAVDLLPAAVKNPVKGDAKNSVFLPSKAIEVAPNLYYLGQAVENGKVVEGYAIIDYKAYAKPLGAGKGALTCYAFLAKGAKWKSAEDYIVNSTNTQGLNETLVKSNIANNILKWEDAADGLINGAQKNVLGSETQGIVDGADTTSPDGQNEVYFGNVEQSNAIAITIVWGIFGGPLDQREILEWDQVYDDADFSWSMAGEAGKMDFENIATHELGHSIGLGDMYSGGCSEQTMYGYASSGETKKRTLEQADIHGISALYR